MNYTLILVETLYLFLLLIPSFIIFFKSREIYNFSRYKGLKYYSLAFLYISIGFLIRYVVMLTKLFEGKVGTITHLNIFVLIMEFFIVLPGFFLLYSLIWQNFEKKHFSSKITFPQYLIYFLAFLTAFADFIMQNLFMMYITQIILFLFATIIALNKYVKKKNNYLQLFFISMFLFFVAWTINFIAQYTIDQVPIMRFYAYIITFSVCFILLYMTLKLIGKK